MISPSITPNALAIASGAILSGLLDALVTKNILTTPEVRSVLQSAMTGIGPRAQSQDGIEALQLVGALLRKLPQSNI